MKDVEILRSFGVLHRTFLTYFSRAIADQGLSYSEGAILANTGDKPGTNQDALALDLVIDKAAIARACAGRPAFLESRRPCLPKVRHCPRRSRASAGPITGHSGIRLPREAPFTTTKCSTVFPMSSYDAPWTETREIG